MIKLLIAKDTKGVWLVTGTNDVGEHVERGFFSERATISYCEAWGVK